MNTLRTLLVTLVLFTPPLALADDEPGVFTRTMRGISGFFGGGASAEAEARKRGQFSSEEIAIIRGALGVRATAHDDDEGDGGPKGKDGKKPKRLPPGLRKKVERGGELPPGWQRKFERGEVVSDELWAQRHGLPNTVLNDINHVPGTEVIQVGDRVARVLTDTREILDIIDLVTGP